MLTEIFLFVVILCLLGLLVYKERLFSVERADMLDRLMSKDLADMKATKEEVVVEEKEEEDERYIDLGSDEAIERMIDAN